MSRLGVEVVLGGVFLFMNWICGGVGKWVKGGECKWGGSGLGGWNGGGWRIFGV